MRRGLAALLGAALLAGRALAAGPAAADAVSACDSATGPVMEVGPGKAYVLPSVAAAVAKDGAVIRIAAGDYRGDVTEWKARRLAICGVGGRVRLFADGKSAQDKATWVVSGADTVIENIEFHGAKSRDRNGAGIRAQHQGDLLIRRCGFFDNENGILGGGPGATVTIERSEFGRNGHGDGQSHNLYIGRVDRLKVTASYFHEAKVGHNLKSRARESRIEGSYFMDGPTGSSSYLSDFPDGGTVVLRGNLYHKGPKAENPNAIAFAAESEIWPSSTLEMLHNTVVMTRPGGSFLLARPATASIRLTANLFAGTRNPTLVTGGVDPARITQASTLIADADDVPGATNLAAPDFWPDPRLRGKMVLAEPPDMTYADDAPKPLARRFVPGRLRLVGALQSHP